MPETHIPRTPPEGLRGMCVEKHGGEIQVASQLGRTTFTVQFPWSER